MSLPERIGRYRLVREIGRGGMGVVYEALDPEFDRLVAVKLIKLGPDVAPDMLAQIEARFRREARAAGGIEHPGVVTMYDLGQHGEYLYLVMQLVAGGSLRQALEHGQYPSRQEAFEIAASVADALGAAHAAGVVHRDVKPENILITPNRRVLVTDFGIAKGIGQLTTTLTLTGMVAGSPAYMSPEQVLDKPIDERTDIFSLGIVLFELLLHRQPFQAADLGSLAYKVAHADPFGPDVRAALSDDELAFLKNCLSKDPDERPSTARSFAQEARRLAEYSPYLGPTLALTGLARGAGSVGTAQKGPGWRHRKGLVFSVLGAVVFLGFLLVQLSFPRSPGHERRGSWPARKVNPPQEQLLDKQDLRPHESLTAEVDKTAQSQTALAPAEAGETYESQRPPTLSSPGGAADSDGASTILTGQLTIRSNVWGDEVYVDGRLLGSTPQVLELAAGRYRVAVRKEGCEGVQESVDLVTGAHRTVLAEIRCPAPKADRETGSRPFRPDPASTGELELRLVPDTAGRETGPRPFRPDRPSTGKLELRLVPDEDD